MRNEISILTFEAGSYLVGGLHKYFIGHELSIFLRLEA
jgi:hypothetical protein